MRVHHSTWRQVFERDQGICQYCGADLLASFSTYWSATVDHVLAVKAGGGDKPENLKLSCPSCNGFLSRSDALTTYDSRKLFVERRIQEEQEGYLDWKTLLRNPASKE